MLPSPRFVDGPYTFTVEESASPGATLFSDINVLDADDGLNSDVTVTCDSAKVCSWDWSILALYHWKFITFYQCTINSKINGTPKDVFCQYRSYILS